MFILSVSTHSLSGPIMIWSYREQNMWCVPNRWSLLYLHVSFFPLLYQHLMHSIPWSDSISATNAPGHTSTFLCFQLPTKVLQALQSANPDPASLNNMFSHGTTFEKCQCVRLRSETFACPKHNWDLNGWWNHRISCWPAPRNGPPGKSFSMKCLWGRCLLQP